MVKMFLYHVLIIKMSQIVEVACPVDSDGNILVGEQLFTDLCIAWIERRGPAILKALLFKNIVKKYQENNSDDEQREEKKRKI
ncbi:MAG: hypothetical protein [Cressdnaviricota sp.]|nr:MAG: hypothetical protein [Cressdnaviricota sp.]